MRYVYVQTYRRTDVCSITYMRVFVVYVGTQFDVASVRTMHVHHAWDVITNALLYVHTHLVLTVDMCAYVHMYNVYVRTYVYASIHGGLAVHL